MTAGSFGNLPPLSLGLLLPVLYSACGCLFSSGTALVNSVVLDDDLRCRVVDTVLEVRRFGRRKKAVDENRVWVWVVKREKGVVIGKKSQNSET